MLRNRLFLLVLSCALVVPTAARASVTLGPVDPNPTPDLSQAINWPSNSLLFTAVAPPGVQLTAPTDGVITSWLLYTDDVGPGATAQLRTLTPMGSKSYAVIGAGAVEPLTPVTPSEGQHNRILHSFSASLPITAGQIVGVGLTRAAGSFVLPVLPVQKGWEYGCLGPGGCISEVPTDSTPVTARHLPEQWLAMNAQLEPDVDHDGLGDETQDPCVGICPSTTQGTTPPAQAPAPVATPTPKKKKCAKGKKRNKRGNCVRKHRKKHRR